MKAKKGGKTTQIRGSLTISGANKLITTHFTFRQRCLLARPCSGIFRWIAVQTQRPIVARQEDSRPQVPLVVGSGRQVTVWFVTPRGFHIV